MPSPADVGFATARDDLAHVGRGQADQSEVIIGRTRELDQLERAIQAARAGQRAALAIVGEPGIGKTTLLQHLCTRGQDAGFAVFTGRGSELEQDVPFALVTDALDERADVLDLRLLRRLGDERLAELAAVLPSLVGSAPRLTSSLELERYRCHQAVRFLLEQLARSRPLLVAFDDVHWADDASIELVAHLLRRRVPRTLLALACRSNQAPPKLTRAIGAALRDGAVTTLELAPLSASDAAQLLGDAFDAAHVRALHSESGGNPFFLEQLSRAPGPAPHAALRSADQDPGSATELPPPMRAAIEQELVRLSPPARLLVEAGAVTGETFELDLAAEIAGLEPAGALAAVDELLAAELVRSVGSRPQLRFRHPILRRAVYDAAKPGWRLGAHRRAARALAARGAAIGAQANHVARAAPVGDEDAIALLVAAARTAAPRAPAAAASWYDAALRLLPDGAAPARRLELLVVLATALATTGRLHDSRTALWQARQLLPDDPTALRSELTIMIARTEQGLGRGEVARRLLTEAIADAAPGSPQAVALELELAENRLVWGDWDGAAAAAAQAHTMTQTLGDEALAITAMGTRSWIETYRGAVAEAERYMDDATRAIDALPDEHLTPQLLGALANLVYSEVATDRYTAASTHAERGLQVCRTGGQGFLFVRFTLGLAVARLCLGQLAAAREASDAAVEASLLLANDQFLATAEGMRCWAATLQGDLDVALGAGEAAMQAMGRAPSSVFSWLPPLCHGEALIAAGHTARGRRSILTAGGVALADVPPTSRTFWQKLLVEAELEAGRIDDAEAIARRIEDAAATLGLPSREGDALYARACVLVARGEHDLAACSARCAVDRYERVGMAVWAARGRLTVGRALALAGHTLAAEDELDAAFCALERCGAIQLADQAAMHLRRLGRPLTRRTRPTPTPQPRLERLSNREAEVAERVSRGYTNRQIAQDLYISPKTIEKHLARVFQKLGVSSRAAVAAAVARRQAAGDGVVLATRD